ncbi:MAG: HNH endonuclease signature motif containing protein [Clostridia bacterium]|jgi:hypothetical protein
MFIKQNAKNRLWNGNKKRHLNCGDITILNPDGSVKNVIPIESIKKAKIRKEKKIDDSRDSEKYNNWRRAVLARDQYKCVLCESIKRIEAHHIIRWIDDIKKRFNQKNGVALCYDCHQKYHNYNKEPFPNNITNALKKYIKFRYMKAEIISEPQTDYNLDQAVNSRTNKNVPG